MFLSGHANAGRLLCIYSGELWRAEDIDNALEQLKAGNDNIQYDLDQCMVL